MIGLLIATHGGLGKTLIECTSLILGNAENMRSLGLFHGDSIEEFQEKIKQSVQEMDDGNGVLILTDLCGGSPSNSTLFLMREFSESPHKIESIVGVNTPMLLEAIEMRNTLTLQELVKHLVSIGKNSIDDVRFLYELQYKGIIMWNGIIASSLVIGVLLLLLWIGFYIIRLREIKRSKHYFQMLGKQTKVGATVILLNGIVGKLISIDEHYIYVEIAPNIAMRCVRFTIKQVLDE